MPWSKVIWFSQGIPRFSFIAWLSVQNRLSTGDRMRVWGVEQPCLLCGERDETRNHLFFACPYTYTVWLDLAGHLLGAAANPAWEETLSYLISSTAHTMESVLLRLLFQVSIYHIWRERNARRHGSSPITVSVMKRLIDKVVRNRITSLRYRFPHKFAVRGF